MVSKPKYLLEIETYEYNDTNNEWILTLSHIFYGNTEDEIIGIVNAHRQTDSFFNASFTGEFEWKGGIIHLKNKVSDLILTK